jgi:hypothetical protein
MNSIREHMKSEAWLPYAKTVVWPCAKKHLRNFVVDIATGGDTAR